MLQLGVKQLSEEIDETLNSNPLLQEKNSTHSFTQAVEQSANWMENLADPTAQTLESHLLQQLRFIQLDSETYEIVCILICCIEDDGYLRMSTDELISECLNQQIQVNGDQIEAALTVLKRLEPAGIACGNLNECFEQQLQRHHCQHKAYKHALLMSEQLAVLSQSRVAAMKHFNLDRIEFDNALKLIKQLYASPGDQFMKTATVYIQPDINLQISDSNLSISLNPLINRGLELNLDYVDLLKKSKRKADKAYLKKTLNNAKWWLNALTQRNKTLMRVADYMIRHQLDYFSKGDIALKPLGQQQIADALDINISTVSRAIKDKYIQTISGVISLNKLLAGQISKNENFIHSNQSVKSIIRQIIKNESSQTPLSDAKIVVKLEKRGIRIARRTVNKYREQLNIPAARQRRLI